MRLLVLLLGVICTLAALMNAYHVAPAWVWVFWAWLAVWVMVGVVVVIAAAVRLATGSGRARLPASAPQRSVPPGAAQGGE